MDYFKNGELKIGGYPKELTEYIVNFQLYDKETWKLFVDQFRFHTDLENDWRGEYWGKMMRGACLTYSITGDKKLYSILTDTVKDMLTVQEKSGRISSRPENNEFKFWDMWCRKYVLLGMEYYLEICKSEQLRKKIVRAMKKHADYIIKRIGNKRNQIAIVDTSDFWGALNSCSILEPMVKLYGLTGEKRYLDFAEYIVGTGCCKDFDLIKACIDKKLYPYQFPYVKAYEMMSCFEGVLELYKYTDKKDYLTAVINFADMVTESDYTIIGGCGCRGEHFDNSSVTQTNSVGDDVEQETCVTVTFMKLCAKLYLMTGDVKYVEIIEKSGYNAMFGAVNNERQTMKYAEWGLWGPDGKNIFPDHESFPFDSYSPLYYDRRGKGIGGFKVLQSGRSYGCCACIGSAGPAIFALSSITHSDKDLFINLYNDCTLKTNSCDITVKANVYKKNIAKIKIIGKGEKFSVYFRKPTWAENMKVYLNGSICGCEEKDGYIKIERIWANDLITLKFRQPVKMHVLNGKVAFTKGPITLAQDARFDKIERPLNISVADGKNVKAKIVKNELFSSNVAVEIMTKNGGVILCDYSQAGKNFDQSDSELSVWQDVKRF